MDFKNMSFQELQTKEQELKQEFQDRVSKMIFDEKLQTISMTLSQIQDEKTRRENSGE